jgi:hypothetical protein
MAKSLGRKLRSNAASGSQAQPVDLTPYRLRATILAAGLSNMSRSDLNALRQEFTALLRELEGLIQQLQATKVAEREYQLVKTLLEELRQASFATAALDDLDRLRAKAEGVMRTFAGDTEVPARKEFWK